MPTAEIPTRTKTRFEPPSYSTEELGETIELSRRQSQRPRSLGTESPSVIRVISHPAQYVFAFVEHEAPARDLQVLHEAWVRTQGMFSWEPRAIEFSRAVHPTATTSRNMERRAEVLRSAWSGVTNTIAEKPAVVEQEYELFVTPEPKRVRHVTARIVSRGRGEPNPVLD